MKRLMFIAALAAVSACSKSGKDGGEVTAAPAASASLAQVLAADGKSSVGKYKITNHDGKFEMEDVKADGTYSNSVDGKVSETGKWEQKAPGTYCYTSDKKGSVQICNEEKVENGVWTSKNPKGEVVTVERVES